MIFFRSTRNFYLLNLKELSIIFLIPYPLFVILHSFPCVSKHLFLVILNLFQDLVSVIPNIPPVIPNILPIIPNPLFVIPNPLFVIPNPLFVIPNEVRNLLFYKVRPLLFYALLLIQAMDAQVYLSHRF